jgi:hypothetical protein
MRDYAPVNAGLRFYCNEVKPALKNAKAFETPVHKSEPTQNSPMNILITFEYLTEYFGL